MDLPLPIGWLAAIVIAGAALALVAWFIASRRRVIGDDALDAVDGGTPGRAGPVPAVRADEPGLAQRFFQGMTRSREALSRSLSRVLGAGAVDEDALQDLEDALVGADVGVKAAMTITAAVREEVRLHGEDADLRAVLRRQVLARLGDRVPLARRDGEPLAILVVGVNGSGKTTTIGKLAALYQREGLKVVLAAGDTFRAGAIEQLKVWGERAGVPVVAHQEGADPAAVIFDAMKAAQARGMDVVICDSAGRLQAQRTLMDELGKVVRVMDKASPGAPHEVLLVLDATIGQNALSQARVFKDVVGVTGAVLTKLDGTARGGVVVAVREEMGIPVKLVGLGEGIDDLREFDPEAFVEALLGPSREPRVAADHEDRP